MLRSDSLAPPAARARGLRRSSRTFPRQPWRHRPHAGAAAHTAAGGATGGQRAAARRRQPGAGRRSGARRCRHRRCPPSPPSPAVRIGVWSPPRRSTAMRWCRTSPWWTRKARTAAMPEGAAVPAAAWAAATPATLQQSASRSRPEDRRLAHRHPDRAGDGRPQQPVPPPRQGHGGGCHRRPRRRRRIARPSRCAPASACSGRTCRQRPTDADFTVQGQVKAVPIPGNKQRIEIQWMIKNATGPGPRPGGPAQRNSRRHAGPLLGRRRRGGGHRGIRRRERRDQAPDAADTGPQPAQASHPAAQNAAVRGQPGTAGARRTRFRRRSRCDDHQPRP